MTGNAAWPRAGLTCAMLLRWRSRSDWEPLRFRTAAVAAAQIGGGRAVVKMNPGAYDRTASIKFAVPVMYPSRQPNALASVVPRRHACAARAVHPDGVDLVAIGHGVISL